MSRLLLLTLLLLAAGPLVIGEAAPTPQPAEEAAADAVLKALAAGEAQQLEALAARDAPDPWRVADVLIARKKLAAAARFAAAAPRKVVARLPAYVASRSGKSDAASRAALAAMLAAYDAKDWKGVLAATTAWDGEIEPAALDSVPLILLAYGRGRALREVGRHKEGAALFSAAAEAALTLGWARFAASAYDQAGTTSWGRNWSAALVAWNARLEVLRYLGDESAVAATLLDKVGKAQTQLRDLAAALASYTEAAGLFRKQKDSYRLARALFNSGDAQQQVGNLSEALPLYEEALALSRVLKSDDGIARNLTGRAGVLLKLGSHEQALADCAEAVRQLETAGKRPGVTQRQQRRYRLGLGIALSTSGTVRQRMGHFAAALGQLTLALEQFRALRHAPSIAKTLNNIGNVHLRLGGYPEAIASYEEALGILERFSDQGLAARAIKNLGDVERDRERVAEARSYYERAIRIFEQTEDRTGRAYALNDLASLDVRYEKKFAAARDRYGDALKLFLRLGDNRGIALVLVNIGTTWVRQGDFVQAAVAYQQADERLDEFPDPTIRVALLWSMAWMRYEEKRYPEAVAFAREGIEMVSDLAEGLAEGEGASTRDVFRDLFNGGVRAALAADDVTAQTWMFEHDRADSLRKGLASRGALQAAVVPEPLRLALAKAKDRLTVADKAYARAVKRGKTKPLRAALSAQKAASDAVLTVTKQIQREAKAAAQLVFDDPDDLTTIRGYLEEGEALVAYGLTDGEAVAVVTTNKGGRMVALGSSEEVREMAKALQAGDREVPQKKVEAAATVLRKRLVDRLGLDKDVQRVLISPTGVLGYIPFALLFREREIAYVPSGTTYGMLLAQRELRGKNVLALGDPDYTTHARRLQRLGATAEEIEKIGTKKLKRAEANETALRKALLLETRWRSVHFACHGLVDAERASLSSLALAKDAENDGFLNCLEIFQMKIPADMVVLSACETGKGRIYKTEGIVGLTRAFMFAGAPRVICSLWKVDDVATRALMLKFYELWNPKSGKGGLGPAEALEQAQAYVRDHVDAKGEKHWAHPYYWAAWVLWGLPQ